VPDTLAAVVPESFHTTWKESHNAVSNSVLDLIRVMPGASLSSSTASTLRLAVEERFASEPCRPQLPGVKCQWSVIVETQPAGLQFTGNMDSQHMSFRDPLGLMIILHRRQCR
jgi:hypothetical protein